MHISARIAIRGGGVAVAGRDVTLVADVTCAMAHRQVLSKLAVYSDYNNITQLLRNLFSVGFAVAGRDVCSA